MSVEEETQKLVYQFGYEKVVFVLTNLMRGTAERTDSISNAYKLETAAHKLRDAQEILKTLVVNGS